LKFGVQILRDSLL